MAKQVSKKFLFCALVLHAAATSLGQQFLSEERKLIADGENADAGRFDSYVTVENTFGDFLSGVLVTPNTVLFGGFSDHDVTVDQIQRVNIGRLGDLEVKGVSQVKVLKLNTAGFITNTSVILAVLDSASTKTPATIDAGSCELSNGCLDVSVVGRGRTSYTDDTPNLGLNQPLQQADFTLLEPSSCLNHYDRDRLYYDFVYAYYANYYGCADLSCANKTKIVDAANRYNDAYLDLQRLYVDENEALFQTGKTICLKNLQAGICQGDRGAPVFSEDDILVGLALSDVCVFDGAYDILPVSIQFTSGIIELIETELASLPGANPSLSKAAAEECQCSKAISFSPSAVLLALTSTILSLRALI